MKKQIKIVALAAVSLLSVSAMAGATDINLYGSSAQYPYWATQAQDYLSKLGCTGFQNQVGTTATGVSTGLPSGVSCFALQGTGCTSSLTNGTVNFRYCSNSSVTGIQAVAGSNGDVDSCGSAYKRMMINPDGSQTVACQTVLGGVSDVSGEAFTQSSNGNKLGPLGGAVVTPSYAGISTSALGLTAYNTVVTPFAFYVNKQVTATHCTGGLVGNLCASNADCNSQANLPTPDGVCNTTPTTINNLSRTEAVLLFSGQVADWSYLGQYYSAQPVTLCYRHAGSGTHATLQYAVMNKTWGGALPTAQSTATAPYIWFNNATGDEENCINGDTTSSTTGSAIAAVGYADANIPFGAVPPAGVGVAGKSQNIVQVKYQGFYPTRSHVRNGEYEFYAVSFLYLNNGANSSSTNLLTNLITYAQNPANVPTSLVNYWPSLSEMWFVKANDFVYPVSVNATNPQTP
jgi:ABC-type phosphate transport system substrate-binding protein